MAPASAPRRSIGDYIRDQRKTSRLSLRELASMSKVSNAYLSQVERGLHQPSVRVLRAIADALELSAEQMLTHAGLTPAPTGEAGDHNTAGDTERAIAHDQRLTEDDRRTLLSLYRRLAGLPG